MKHVIAVLLFPLTIIILIVKTVFEWSYTLGKPVIDGIIEISNKNYDFWKKFFKWK